MLLVASEPDAFEWYQEYGALKHILSRYTTKQTTALVVGCGTSLLSEELHRAEVKSVISIDFSQVAIDIQKKKYAAQQGMQCQTDRERQERSTKGPRDGQWKEGISLALACSLVWLALIFRGALPPPLSVGVMDVRKLEFQNERFDLIVDKGTLDSILCADDAEVSAAKAISEIARTLVSGGVFVMVSHAGPEHREALLKVPSDCFIQFQYATIVKPRVDDSVDQKDDEVHYVYVAIKGKAKK